MINKVVLIGRLTRDPDLRYTKNSTATCSFTLAVNRRFTNQAGEQEADFIHVVTWKGLAESCNKFLRKGRLVAVTGRLQTRNYEGNDGLKRFITEVVAEEVQFLESGQKQSQVPAPQDQTVPAPPGFEPVNGEDDELPF